MLCCNAYEWQITVDGLSFVVAVNMLQMCLDEIML